MARVWFKITRAYFHLTMYKKVKSDQIAEAIIITIIASAGFLMLYSWGII